MLATTKLSTGDAPAHWTRPLKIERAEAPAAVREALRCGYRHLDKFSVTTATVSRCEGIRQALAAGICRREELWVTSKLWNTYHAKEHVRPAVERTPLRPGPGLSRFVLGPLPDCDGVRAVRPALSARLDHRPAHPEQGMKLAKVPRHEVWGAMEEPRLAPDSCGTSAFATIIRVTPRPARLRADPSDGLASRTPPLFDPGEAVQPVSAGKKTLQSPGPPWVPPRRPAGSGEAGRVGDGGTGHSRPGPPPWQNPGPDRPAVGRSSEEPPSSPRPRSPSDWSKTCRSSTLHWKRRR